MDSKSRTSSGGRAPGTIRKLILTVASLAASRDESNDKLRKEHDALVAALGSKLGSIEAAIREYGSANKPKYKWEKPLRHWLTVAAVAAGVAVAVWSLIALRTAQQLDRRPWLGPSSATVTVYEVGKKFTARLDLVNSGKTPALNVEPDFLMKMTGPQPAGPPDDAHPKSGYQTGGIVFPNQPMLSPLESRFPLTPDEFASFQKGDSSFIAWGEVRYRDTEGQPHVTHVCLFFNRTMGAAGIMCTNGNSAN